MFIDLEHMIVHFFFNFYFNDDVNICVYLFFNDLYSMLHLIFLKKSEKL